jgi:5-methyltetrahydrofolate--homocysteine methyltransferase
MSGYDYSLLTSAVIKSDIKTAVSETEKALAAGCDVQEILDRGLIAAMDEVGERFSKGQMFVPQMLRSAKSMQECMVILKPHFQEGKVAMKGKVIMGTVKGDLHDIGKNLVAMMLEGAGFQIVDLGVDVPAERFVEAVREEGANIIGMSALLSTTMPSMRDTVNAFVDLNIRDQVKIIIGGAPVTEDYAWEIGADGYAPDAGSVVTRVKKLMGIE